MKIGLPSRRKTTSGAKLQEARLRAARANTHWTELEAVDLVARPGGLLVAASDDAVYTQYRGAIWERGSATMISDQAALFWFEQDDGELTFLERQPETWSQVIEKQERRSRATP